MEKIALSHIEPGLAAQLLAGSTHLDPSGLVAERDLPAIAARGACFAATGDGGSQAVYIVHVSNGVAWIDACRGFGPADWSGILLPVIERQAQGVASVRFQTSRAGLVRRAQHQGYQVKGWILGKELQ